MKKPVPMPRTGCSRSPPAPYIRSRKSWNGSCGSPRAVTATMPTTAGMACLTSCAIDCGGEVGRVAPAGASVQTFCACGAAAAAITNAASIPTPWAGKRPPPPPPPPPPPTRKKRNKKGGGGGGGGVFFFVSALFYLLPVWGGGGGWG